MESTDGVGKWFFYERVIEVPTYVIFRPDTGRIEVYTLDRGIYRPQKVDATGRYGIAGLDLFLGVWQGSHEDRTGYWLRWWNAQGELLLWSEERTEQERQRAEQERQRAEQERLDKELAQQQVEQERQRAEQERLDKELAQQQVEQSQALLEQERQRSQLLLERWRSLGIDPGS